MHGPGEQASGMDSAQLVMVAVRVDRHDLLRVGQEDANNLFVALVMRAKEPEGIRMTPLDDGQRFGRE